MSINCHRDPRRVNCTRTKDPLQPPLVVRQQVVATKASAAVSTVLAPLARRLSREHGVTDSARDVRLFTHALQVLDRVTGLFTPDVRNVQHIPSTGPVLIVANHSCVIYMPDAAVVADAVAHRRGPDRPLYGLAYDLLFAAPLLGSFIRRLGLLPASESAAVRALSEDAAVLVFPGGDHDACRPWSERDRIEFGRHQGFVRLALRTGVPVVPAVAHGAHHGMMILARGEPLARALGLQAVRVKVMPVALSPLGPVPILPPPPLPTHVIVDFLEPIDWSRYPPSAADDPAIVDACYDEITQLMQARLDQLATENPHPVTAGLMTLANRWLALASRHTTRRSAPVARS